jgi:hypothetical protein
VVINASDFVAIFNISQCSEAQKFALKGAFALETKEGGGMKNESCKANLVDLRNGTYQLTAKTTLDLMSFIEAVHDVMSRYSSEMVEIDEIPVTFFTHQEHCQMKSVSTLTTTR